ncbi:MAG: hypothetical protein ABIR56_07685 [Polaromonas sp.]
MSRCQKEPLRPLTEQERQALERIVESGSERTDVVARIREVLAVAWAQPITMPLLERDVDPLRR